VGSKELSHCSGTWRRSADSAKECLTYHGPTIASMVGKGDPVLNGILEARAHQRNIVISAMEGRE